MTQPHGLTSSAAYRKMSEPAVSSLPFGDFSGGLNVNDAPAKVGDTEFIAGRNVTLDERGGAMMRLGLQRLNASPFAGTASSLAYSAALDVFLLQIGATLYKTNLTFGTLTVVATFTSSKVAGTVDFTGKAVVAHPTDGVFVYDGTSWTLATAAVKGGVVAVWQNKVWVSGNDATVWWCNAGNVTAWTTTTDFNAVRDKDDKPVTAFAVGIGQNYLAHAGLLAFKEDSFYRINDAQTGSYTTMSLLAGASGPHAVVALEGGTVFFGKNGIFTTNGLDAGATWVSKNVRPMFSEQQMNFAALGAVVGERYYDRVLFSFPWGAGQAKNNRTFEYHPADGWIVVHDFGAAAFCVYSKGSARLLSASPAAGYVRDTFVGGSDEGAPIYAFLQTKWLVPESGYLCQFLRVRATCDGELVVAAKLDYDDGPGLIVPADVSGNGFVWNQDVWGATWGPLAYQHDADYHNLGAGKALSLLLSLTSSQVRSLPALNGDGASQQRGAFSIYGLLIDYVRLGLA